MERIILQSSASYLSDRRGRLSDAARVDFNLSDLTTATAQLENLVRINVGDRACAISPKRMPSLRSVSPQIHRCVPVCL